MLRKLTATDDSQFGFFANRSGHKGVRVTNHLLALAMCAFLTIKGAGAVSVDRKLSLAGRS